MHSEVLRNTYCFVLLLVDLQHLPDDLTEGSSIFQLNMGLEVYLKESLNQLR